MPDDEILQWGSPALYARAPLVEVFDDLLAAQARRLCRRLVAAAGAGLAATQVGSLRRMFAYRLSPAHGAEVLVNPRITWRSERVELFTEGCLSFQSVLVTVARPEAVIVTGCDVDGTPREFTCEGGHASLFQHEIDHLDGILTLHRAEPAERYRALCALLELGEDAGAGDARAGLRHVQVPRRQKRTAA